MGPILVTGGAGFIGSCFVREWLRHELSPIVNLDKLTYASSLMSLASVWDDPYHQFIQGDIGDHDLLTEILCDHQPSAIVHLAAESHVDRSIDGPAAFVKTNVLGTCVLLEAVLEYWRQLSAERRAAFRFLHVSTDEVYGALGAEGASDEFAPYRPRSPYSASKAASDHFVRAYYYTYGLPVVVTHCTNNYGPFQHPEKLIPLMILNAQAGRALPVYGDGRQIRDWIFVEDHCRALRCVLSDAQPGETFNIGGDCERTNLQVVDLVCQIVDALRPDLSHVPTRNLITFVADRPGHDRRYAIDPHKITSRLGWRPRESFVSGMQPTVAWYLENDDWIQSITQGNQPQRLGLAHRMA